MNSEEKKELLESFGNVVEIKLRDHLKPVEDDMIKVKQTVWGVTGDNGLCGELKTMKTRLRSLERVAYVWNGAVTAFLVFKESIFGR
jgi:hypothetical protein